MLTVLYVCLSMDIVLHETLLQYFPYILFLFVSLLIYPDEDDDDDGGVVEAL